MKKLLSLIICFAIMFSFIGCGNTNDTAMVSNEISTNDKTNVPYTEKEYYLDLLDHISRHDNKYEEKASNKEKLEINTARLKKWVKTLKQIYGELQADLPEDTMNSLHQEEIEWIKDSKAKAENASKKSKDKDVREIIYLDNLIESIKDRCYELVNTYMPN